MDKQNQGHQSKITIFHCINVFADGEMIQSAAAKIGDAQFIKLPCSSMVKDVYLMRAFEKGADVVAVLVCPEGVCRYVEGNLRAAKRVQWVKTLLDDIGLDGRRLVLFNVPAGNVQAIERAFEEALNLAVALGPNPITVYDQ